MPEYKEELDRLSGLSKKYPNAFKESKITGMRGVGTELLSTAFGYGAGAHLLGEPLAGLAAGAAAPIAAKAAATKLLERPGFVQFILKNLESKAQGPLAELAQRMMGGTPGQVVRGGILGTLTQQ